MLDTALPRANTRQTGLDVRRLCRNGGHVGPTSGMAPGFVQGNLAVLPKEYAADFVRFCQLNPKPCPLIGMSPAPGDHRVPELGADLDIATDLPRYRVWRDGVLVEEPTDIRTHWRDDLVAFVLGCSFSFEEALIEDGIELRHIACGSNVPMYRTSIETVPVGPFRGPMVVSMRPLRPDRAIRAVQITSRFPSVHGAPVHIGLPGLIGIRDLARPDYGDPPPRLDPGHIPVFWACGVTPQVAVLNAKPPLCITHKPGAMLITDRLNRTMAST